ncbi:hypothetical protein LUZ63_001224 [Rhynchospora breviuscula]|uniref:BRCT domain-containing protein n=1 Tax=Rhynchospora breviuscula TaxID=2022672 RepID=A0A9Q0HXD1_9POAL|nr:hypothetical protein LUZ63_001224 [Rhynchospora breviuscula]
MAYNGVEVITSKGCSRLLIGTRPAFCSVRSTEMMSTTSSAALLGPTDRLTDGPFHGLVICVTGLSKEARNQVMEATERLGGQYSGSLHPKCTHLVVQSSGGRKYDHAIKHGARNGLFVVTLGWFVDSVRKNVRLDESLYSVGSLGENGLPLGELNRVAVLPGSERSCIPLAAIEEAKSSKREFEGSRHIFSEDAIYMDPDISAETKSKIADAVTREGAKLLEHWFIGSKASYVICEGSTIHKYIAHSNKIVTPLWILKTVKEKSFQRLVHLSSDLAKHVAITLENTRLFKEDAGNRTTSPFSLNTKISPSNGKPKESIEDRKKIVELAKQGVRDRRSRRMQSCQVPIHPITPTSLLDSICWSISEPTTSACTYTDSSWSEEASEQQSLPAHDTNGEPNEADLFANSLSRPLKESEKSELVFKNHLITILFPIDRFDEMGPTSRTFFSNNGFTCIQLLDYIYNFYQENLSDLEIEVGIHTDSRHADRLRSLYASSESVRQGFVLFKRVDFMGSRRSFESLKRLNGETNCNVYQLLVRA